MKKLSVVGFSMYFIMVGFLSIATAIPKTSFIDEIESLKPKMPKPDIDLWIVHKSNTIVDQQANYIIDSPEFLVDWSATGGYSPYTLEFFETNAVALANPLSYDFTNTYNSKPVIKITNIIDSKYDFANTKRVIALGNGGKKSFKTTYLINGKNYVARVMANDNTTYSNPIVFKYQGGLKQIKVPNPPSSSNSGGGAKKEN